MVDETLLKKLRISSGGAGVIVNAPLEYQSLVDGLVPDLTATGTLLDFGLLFVRSVAELDRHFPDFVSRVKFDGVMWVAYPKKKKRWLRISTGIRAGNLFSKPDSSRLPKYQSIQPGRRFDFAQARR